MDGDDDDDGRVCKGVAGGTSSLSGHVERGDGAGAERRRQRQAEGGVSGMSGQRVSRARRQRRGKGGSERSDQRVGSGLAQLAER